MSDDAVSEAPSALKVAILRAWDVPLSWYHSACQVKWSPGLKKLFVVSTVSAVSLVVLAHFFKRRRGKKKKASFWEPELLLLENVRADAWEKGSSCSSSRQNLTLSLSSAKERGSQSLHANGGLLSKHSGSMQSLASVHSVNSCHSYACPNPNCWDKAEDDEMKIVNIPVTTPENLYLMGMELFEEALRRWEQALTFRNRKAEEEASCSSIKIGAGDAIAEESVEDIISADFIHKLESLLQRAYRLQEEFEATLGASDPASLANDLDKDTDITVKDNADGLFLRDTLSIASTDSFVSAAELSEQRGMRSASSLDSLNHCPLYEEAMHLAEEGKVYCRVLRTEMLECLGDSDFLAKLHCIRQAFQLILSESSNRIFLVETARKVLSALMAKARKNPKKFEDAFDEIIYFLEQINQWETTEIELVARGVKKLNFYDIVIDFIIMDSFEDLDNPPTSIHNVVNNRWLNSSFKETAVATSCWSILKQKKQQMKVTLYKYGCPMDSLHTSMQFVNKSVQCWHGASWVLGILSMTCVVFSSFDPIDHLFGKLISCHVACLACFTVMLFIDRNGILSSELYPMGECVLQTPWLVPLFQIWVRQDQVLYFLKDIFDFEKVRFSNTESLSEDIMQLLHRRSELLMAYLGIESHKNGFGCGSGPALSSTFVETKLQ